jgi:hypothetical protein
VRLPKESGIDPTKLLLARLRIIMFVPFVQQFGMNPAKKFEDKSRVSNELLRPNISHTCEIVP